MALSQGKTLKYLEFSIQFHTDFTAVGVQQNQIDRYLELVKEVGLQLRALLTSVDSLVPYFPQSAHKQVTLIRYRLYAVCCLMNNIY